MASDELGRRFIVGTFELDVAVAVHTAFRLHEAGKEVGRQGPKGGLLDLFEVGANLFASGAVNALVGDTPLPITQVHVERGEVLELLALHRTLFDVTDVALHLALVLRGAWARRQGRHVVVRTEGRKFRIKFGVVDVGLEHSGLQIVEHQQLRSSAEVSPRVLDAAHEALGVLAWHRLGVALARVAQGHAQDVNLAPLSPDLHPQRSIVDLGLLACLALHAPHPLRLPGLELGHESLHRLVAVFEAVVVNEVLPDPLRVEGQLQLALDELAIGFTPALLPSPSFCLRLFGAGGRGGTL